MKKARKWWKIPLIISFVLGSVLGMTSIVTLLNYPFRDDIFQIYFYGPLFGFMMLMIFIWGLTFTILGIRKLIQWGKQA